MKSTDEIDYVTIIDEHGQPQKRPRNKLYEMIAERQEKNRVSGITTHVWGPLIKIEGEPLSQTIIRERRGDFD